MPSASRQLWSYQLSHFANNKDISARAWRHVRFYLAQRNLNNMAAQGRRHIDGLMQERRNSIALAMDLRLSCTNP